MQKTFGARRAASQASSSTFKAGDKVSWNSHGGTAKGTVKRMAHQSGEVSGFKYKASKEDPRVIIKMDNGQHVAHTKGALKKC